VPALRFASDAASARLAAIRFRASASRTIGTGATSAAASSLFVESLCPCPAGDQHVDEAFREQFFRLAQHQLRLRVVHAGGTRREQSQVDASGAALQGGATGDHRGPDHSRRAAQNADAACLSLVEVSGTGRDRAGQDFFVEQHPLGFEEFRRIDSSVSSLSSPQ